MRLTAITVSTANLGHSRPMRSVPVPIMSVVTPIATLLFGAANALHKSEKVNSTCIYSTRVPVEEPTARWG